MSTLIKKSYADLQYKSTAIALLEVTPLFIFYYNRYCKDKIRRNEFE